MTAERFRQIRNVFEAAMDHGETDRAAWLAEACQGDIGLRAEVDALLKQYEKRAGVLDAPAADALSVSRLEGPRIGAWEILREIGRGGMAVVYLARRADGAFQMQAAVKVLNTPFADDEIRKRFQQEREILAQLDHLNIARLLDGGTSEDGLPYLVMEYVEGQPLTTWCDDRKASVEERLRLFEQLCEVVHYLHEHHVIHRDLKPSNVLVNAAGTVKLLDFGISKLLEPVTERTILATQSGLHLLTPEYASPEQVRGDRVTPQTDVYALGVILYELLTGRRPYRLRSRVMHEVVRAICEDEPERPSTAVTKADESTDPITTSRLRQASPERLSRALRGDLDEIIMKALRKAPERRYRTARQLSEDLIAQAQGKSILARGDSWFVCVFQALNRHRVSVALVIVATALLASGAITFNIRAVIYTAAALIAIGFWYAATDPKLGRRIASAAGAMQFALWILIAQWGLRVWRGLWPRSPGIDTAETILEYVIFGCSVYLGTVSLAWFFRRRWAGELVLDASHGRLWLLRLEFRDLGIVYNGRLIPWHEIESWTWQRYCAETGSAPQFLFRSAIPAWGPQILKIERRRAVHFLPPVTPIEVPRSKVDDVTRVMNQYLSEWPTPTEVHR